jgi:hypothetical protein
MKKKDRKEEVSSHIFYLEKIGAFVALKPHPFHLRGNNLFKIKQEFLWFLESIWTQWGERESVCP